MSGRRRQAFKQSPWRMRVRSVGRTALVVVALLVIGGIYLSVNAKLARAGREVMTLESEKEELLLRRTSLMSELASLTAPQHMMDLAVAMGFRAATPDEIEFIVVEGYVPPEPFVAPLPLSSGLRSDTTLSPAYTETLGQWLARLFRKDQQ